MFCKRLKLLRKENGWNQSELGRKAGISRSAIGMYEQGKREPDFETLEDLADIFNVDIDYLLGNTDIRRKYDLEVLRKTYELDSILGGIAKKNSDIDKRFLRSYVKLDDSHKKLLIDVIETMARD